jgi:hypothetical protein
VGELLKIPGKIVFLPRQRVRILAKYTRIVVYA